MLKKSPGYAIHCGDNLGGVQHTVDDLSGVQLSAETNSTLQVKIFTCLWLLLKGQLVEILLGVNSSIMKEKILGIKV